MAAIVIPIPVQPQPVVQRSELPFSTSGTRAQMGLALWYDISHGVNGLRPDQLLAYPELTNDRAAVFTFDDRGTHIVPIFTGLSVPRSRAAAALDAVASSTPTRPLAFNCRIGETDDFNFIILPFSEARRYFVCIFE